MPYSRTAPTFPRPKNSAGVAPSLGRRDHSCKIAQNGFSDGIRLGPVFAGALLERLTA